MCRHSYVLLATNTEQENEIIHLLHEHNRYVDGEPFVKCVVVSLLKSKPKNFSKYDRAIICTIYESKNNTFDWFEHNKISFMSFSNQKWLSTMRQHITI